MQANAPAQPVGAQAVVASAVTVAAALPPNDPDDLKDQCSDKGSGTYFLRDNSETVNYYVGRTINYDRREGEHARSARNERLPQHVLKPVHQTSSRTAQKGLEQMLYDRYAEVQRVNGGYNKIRPVGKLNPLQGVYKEAARDYLLACGDEYGLLDW